MCVQSCWTNGRRDDTVLINTPDIFGLGMRRKYVLDGDAARPAFPILIPVFVRVVSAGIELRMPSSAVKINTRASVHVRLTRRLTVVHIIEKIGKYRSVEILAYHRRLR